MDVQLRRAESLYRQFPNDPIIRQQYRLELSRSGAPIQDLSILKLGDIVSGYDPLMGCIQISYLVVIGSDFVQLDPRQDLSTGYPLGIWTFSLAQGDEIVLIKA